MPREDIFFNTTDHVTLRGWFYKPTTVCGTLPCLVLVHGFSAVKEMHLDDFAEAFTSQLPIACLVYDHRGYGDSDTKDGSPRQETLPWVQASDFSDAITYAQMREDVDAHKIGIWGTSFAGGLALHVGAVDRRVKAVLSSVPFVDGWSNAARNIRGDIMAAMQHILQQDRISRAAGDNAGTIPVVSDDSSSPAALPSTASYKFLAPYEATTKWKNEVTIRTMEAVRGFAATAYIQHIAPTPLLMSVAENDTLCPVNLALEAYSRALEPKQLQIIRGGHFDCYRGKGFEKLVQKQVAFLRETLCAAV